MQHVEARSYSFESPFLVDVAKAKLITRRNIQNLWVQDAIPKVSDISLTYMTYHEIYQCLMDSND